MCNEQKLSEKIQSSVVIW